MQKLNIANLGASPPDGSGLSPSGRSPRALYSSGRQRDPRISARALEPKVRTPFQHKFGQVPRKVEIERQKRVNESVDIEAILNNVGLSYNKPRDFSGTELPLDSFDDTTFDSRTPNQWMELADQGGALPCMALHHDSEGWPSWQYALVTEYSEGKRKFLVEWNANGRRCYLPRVDIWFGAEDPFNFANRVAAAHAARQEALSQLKLTYFIQSMPRDERHTLEEDAVERIRYTVFNTLMLRDRHPPLSGLLQEVETDYQLTMNKLAFMKNLNHPSQRQLKESLALRQSEEDVFEVVPWLGTVPCVDYSFADAINYFTAHSFLISKDVVRALMVVRSECEAIGELEIFNTNLVRAVTVHEFRQLQGAAFKFASKTVREQWVQSIAQGMKAQMGEMVTSWFTPSNMGEYAESKVKKVMMTARYMMEDALRDLMVDALRDYTEFLEYYGSERVEVIHAGEVHLEDPYINDGSRPTRKAMLSLELITLEDGKFGFNFPLDSLAVSPLLLFDEAVGAFASVPQVEPLVMDLLSFRGVNNLTVVDCQHSDVAPLRQRVEACMQKSTEPLHAFLRAFEIYSEIVSLNVDSLIESLRADAEPATISQHVEHYRALAHKLAEELPQQTRLGMFLVSCERVKKKLQDILVDAHKQLCGLLQERGKIMAAKLAEKRSVITTQLNVRPQSIEEVANMREYMGTIPETFAEFKQLIESTMEYYDILENNQYILETGDFNTKWESYGIIQSIEKYITNTDSRLEEDIVRFERIMSQEQNVLGVEINRLNTVVLEFGKNVDSSQTNIYAAECERIMADLNKSKESARAYNSREQLLEKDMTDYSELPIIIKQFEPYYQLWQTNAFWNKMKNEWKCGVFLNISAEDMERDLGNGFKTMFKLSKTFKDNVGLSALAEKARDEMQEFKPLLPLVIALRNPGMRDRHWEALSKELEMELRPNEDETFTLNKAVELGLLTRMEVINRYSDVAGKEYSIENALNKMTKEWVTINIQTMAYRDTGTYILKGIDEVSQVLDDHIVMTQSMSFSAFKKPFEERIAEWEAQLNLVSEIIDEWLACQRNWMYLEPIFSSEDINRQLPVEGKRFASVDRFWRRTMEAVVKTPHVLTFVGTQKKLLEKFHESNELLELVQKGLSDYLETKRAAFARFYFLSNDELIEILSQTKDPLAVQPHLRKCFENVYELEFKKDLSIVAMRSAEKEEVPFEKPLKPVGNVETWLGDVESMMKRSVRRSIADCLVSFKKTPRTEWIQKWPGQSVLAVDGIVWTENVRRALVGENGHSLQQQYDDQIAELLDLTALVRTPLPDIVRMTIGAVMVVDVHARDVIRRMLDAGVSSENDFDWISQLRYYMEDGEVVVKMVQTTKIYGYEYLGNTSRLVITPLTDRCYMTLMSALHLYLGGAPAGPAGTGKTETTKDLAKALAKQCVVFNCSDGLDYLAMGKFFKGLAMSGAWACFDEFNRIDIEVLSVIAQQITTIQQAIVHDQKRFLFEGSEISLDPTCAVFITMNPGYAGRTELPDNLKALFRPMSMMVPDYGMIAEIRLYSFGFREASILARKIVSTFKLSSEQLSSQDHYDFGMRAVNTVIMAAGHLKKNDPDMNEDQLLLRALRDSNLPKFLSEDIPLFTGVISDLFPGISQPAINYGSLMEALVAGCEKFNLQPEEVFLQKCIQLYDTTVVRHGLMLVGPTGGGKTNCYKVLQHAMTSLAHEPVYEKVHTHVINPKSITMGQLYGQFDPVTHEWSDGIIAGLIRVCSQDTKPDKKWVIFDGPVDALWIENMNTVLDDNKKLCLTSGEIIKLTPEMEMIFEVEDLAVASPATVSRCGMVYMEPGPLGTKPLILSWLKTLNVSMEPHLEDLQVTLELLVDSSIYFLRHECKEVVATVDNNLVFSLFRLLDAQFEDFSTREGQPPPADTLLEKLNTVLHSQIIFACIWSFGASTDAKGREKFDSFIRQQVPLHNMKCQLPSKGSVYDYCFNHTLGWKLWMMTVPEYKMDPRTPFSKIIVPTTDTVRTKYIMDLIVTRSQHVLVVGPTGTGKTVTIQDKLMHELPEVFVPQFITFSAQTSANQTQDILDGKLDKRRKGVFGPPAGKKFVLYVDDTNMPAREVYGAQPPIELLRQWFDHRGWYDRKALSFMQIVDVLFVCSMGPPGGGRNPVTNRFLRHFHFLALNDMAEESLNRIFSTILGAFIEAFLPSEFKSLTPQCVMATIRVYEAIAEGLLPTPSKSHYTFNLRDLAKVFQGILSVEVKSLSEPADFIRLWAHENMRVFRDRLVDNTDREWFNTLLKTQMKEQFKCDWEKVVQTPRLLYGDFLGGSGDTKSYAQFQDLDKLQAVMVEYLDDYNAVTNKPMKLVLFLDAIEHVCRIARIVRQPGGNALCLGVGGSGRQSLTRLAAHLEEFSLFQIEVAKGYGNHEWKEDLKKVLMTAGLEGNPTVFLFCDTQIVKESFLEDINNILNAGEVPNLWAQEDMDAILNGVRPICQQAGLPLTKMSIYAEFIRRVRSNIHLVICMSPIGEEFRNRLRMFPALVTCCTIDWFSAWPDEALTSVATSFNSEIELPEDIRSAVVEMCMYIHLSVENMSVRYYDEVRRRNYVTPTSYLELLSTLKVLMGEKREEVGGAKQRLAGGLEKLLSTEEQVKVMEQELIALQPQLKETSEEVEVMMVQISKDKEDADVTKQFVVKEEAVASAKAADCKEIADSAQRDLDEALPALDAAVASLKNLNKNDIVEVKTMQRPPAGVKLVMEAVCIMQEVKPAKVAHPTKPGVKVDDYWEPGRGLLANPDKFLQSLFKFDKDNISEKVIEKIAPFVKDDNFTPEQINKVSKACTAICQWTLAMEKYYHVARGVEPKRKALKEASAELEVTMAELKVQKAKLQEVEDRIADLESKYSAAVDKKDELARQVIDCEQKLERANKLISGLGGEKIRWGESVQELTIAFDAVVGDVLVAAGGIAYLGPFTAFYRSELTQEWRAKLAALSLPHSSNCSIVNTLANPVKIREWNMAGLPSDAVSVENGIIVDKARRWPLMIDPQGQANKWIKNTEKETGLDVVKLSDKDLLRTLENAVQFGKPVLLENIEEDLDPALEPILLKQTFKQGGSLMIKLGDSVVPYHPDFRFRITTKLRNPHYRPEVCVKVTLLNFTITPDGLEDQLLGLVVEKERPDLAKAKNQLVISNAKMKKELYELESKILFLLSNSEGNILDDENLINTLAQSKKTSQEISTKVAEAEKTEAEIDVTRSKYQPVAERASILYFTIADLALVDPMYQYSLNWFVQLFARSIYEAARSDNFEERLVNLNESATYMLYVNICRSLFEMHKLMFSFLLCVRIQQKAGLVDEEEWRFLITGGQAKSEVANPDPMWITDAMWGEIAVIDKLGPSWSGLLASFVEHCGEFRKLYDAAEVHTQPFPSIWEERLNRMQRMVLVRALRPDKITPAIQDYVVENLGQKYIEPPTFDLGAAFKDAAPEIPLLFVLSTGADPMAELLKFAGEMRMSKKMNSISLGQGQGPIAEKMIAAGMEQGSWILLQNCHLAVSWMPALERICERFDPSAMHKDFRLWLTSMPSEKFPVLVLQNAVKMTNEPPKGLRSNLLRSYASFDDNYLSASKKSKEWKKLLFAMCFFHAVVQDRRKFGPLGWNVTYEFTNGDLDVCLRQILAFMDEYPEIPYRVIIELSGHINYGGRVTDDWDRRTLLTTLADYVNEGIMQDGYTFSPLPEYISPAPGQVKDYLDYIRSLPLNPNPNVFGLHDNADISCARAETYSTFATILSLQPRVSAGGGMTREEKIETAAVEIKSRLPPMFDYEAASAKYPVTYKESMNTVLVQEIIRYNRLLSIMHSSLPDLLKALKGLVVMSESLDRMGASLHDQTVPANWQARAYPSLMPLAPWVDNLLRRCSFIQTWYEQGKPDCFWFSGFYFPQAFLTGALQNFARKYTIAIDKVSFNFVVKDDLTPEAVTGPPEDGVLIYGLQLEGARWDRETHSLEESLPKVLYSECPLLWLKPESERLKPKTGIYNCPCYKTLTRHGTLSTTGHSTNYVLPVELPCRREESHFIKRGVALFCALDY